MQSQGEICKTPAMENDEPVAITGIGCRFPGGANGPEAFWNLLRSGTDAITEVPPDRWNISAYHDPEPGLPGRTNSRWGGFIEGIDQFDPAFFGISPREAAFMDPQQRIALELTWEALENARIPASALKGQSVGVYIGSSNNDLQLINSDLINNGGAPTIVDVADVISCYFRADERGVAFLTSGRVEGTRFERGTSTTARIYEQSSDTFFAANNAWANFSFNYVVNSSADDIALGNVQFGIFLNSNLPSRPDLSKPAAMAWVGEVTTLADGAVNPRAQLLVGANYAETAIEPGSDAGVTTSDAGRSDAGRSDAGTLAGTQAAGCGCSATQSTPMPIWLLSLLGLGIAARRTKTRKTA